MTLTIKRDLSRPEGGYAIVEGPGLDGVFSISIENCFSGEFLGENGNWAKQPFFFRVEAASEGGLLLGPKIVDCIPTDLMVALRTEQGRKLGTLFWTDVIPTRRSGIYPRPLPRIETIEVPEMLDRTAMSSAAEPSDAPMPAEQREARPGVWAWFKGLDRYLRSPLCTPLELASLCRSEIATRRKTHRSNKRTRISEHVAVSAFSPTYGKSGAQLIFQILLHRQDDAADAAALAREADDQAMRRGASTLAIEIMRGERCHVLLESRDVVIDEPLQEVVWLGDPVACQFLANLPKVAGEQISHLCARVLVDGIPVGALRFTIKVVGKSPRANALTSRNKIATRYHRAFLSYASPDRAEVLKRAQSLRIAGIDFFHDLLSLEPGERWERRLYEEIDHCDLFLLFWSKNAVSSPWVLREAERAATRQKSSAGQPDIIPVVLEGPPMPKPIPEMLKHLHFNDYLSYCIKVSETGSP